MQDTEPAAVRLAKAAAALGSAAPKPQEVAEAASGEEAVALTGDALWVAPRGKPARKVGGAPGRKFAGEDTYMRGPLRRIGHGRGRARFVAALRSASQCLPE